MRELFHEIKTGWNATKFLAILRWRMMRNFKTKFAIGIGASMLLLALLTTVNMGYAAQIAAQTADSRQGDFARLWATLLSVGEMMNIGAFAVGGALFTAFLAPLLGASTVPLAPTEDLYGIRPPRLHRYFDSLIVNSISGLGILQLLVLTAVSSLLTMDGVRMPGIVFAWSVWILFIFLMTTLGWTLEWTFRRFGTKIKRYILASFLVIIGILILIDPAHGGTMFGISPLFTNLVRQDITGWSWDTTASIITVLVITAIIFLIGVQSTRQALDLPAPSNRVKDLKRFKPLGTDAYQITFSMLTRILFRTSEVKKPLIGLILAGFVSMFFIQMDDITRFSLIAAIPLTLALAWGTNIYGLIGTGMVWLESMPKTLKRLPLTIFFLQFISSILLFIVFGMVSMATGHVTLQGITELVVGGVLASFAVTSLSLYLSTSHPHRARLSGRGDSILPPVTAIYYMFILLFAGPVPVALVLSLDNLMVQAIVVSAVALLSIFFIVKTFILWRNKNKRAQLIAITSAA